MLPVSESLMVAVVQDTEHVMQQVDGQTMQKWGVSVEAIHQVAIDNLNFGREPHASQACLHLPGAGGLPETGQMRVPLLRAASPPSGSRQSVLCSYSAQTSGPHQSSHRR